MAQNLEKRLALALERLEKGIEKVRKTRPYSKDEAKMRMLSELIKEQYSYENSHSTTRTPR